jgi:hypothetical protein
MRKSLHTALGMGALLLGTFVAAPAGAQTMDNVGPHNPYCGAWVSGTWTPNGNCVVETTTTTTTTAPAEQTAAVAVPVAADPARVPQRITGTIIGVNGHMVTLQQSNRDLVVDDQGALDRESSGRVAVGRAVTAHGYWKGGTFFANRFDAAH